MAPSPTIRRLLKETAELSSPSSNPNPAFYASPVSDANLHEWHFTILGPPSPSPYAGGMYHGRITLPTTYPLKPPNFRFLTPSGRFETNREICLSISGFHEETWMPAWGVRTALTALRSFMAEKGSAGQVGGLEAPAEIRKKLAVESRTWKCEACGKTNEAVMRGWWDVCRDAGIDLKSEEDISLEDLPEGMALEARDPNAKGETKEKTSQSQPTTNTTAPAPSIPQQQQQSPVRTSTKLETSSTLQTPSHPPYSLVPTPSPEAAQARAEAMLSPTELSQPSTSHRPIGGIHSAPLAAANAAVSQQPQPLSTTTQSQSQSGQPQQPQTRVRNHTDSITIDRAIAGVFLALCLMLLKKIFFPSARGGAFGGSMDDFYLQRD